MGSTRNQLLRIAAHLSTRRKQQIALLLVVTLSAALSELVSLGSVIPFLAVLTEPERVWSASWMQRIAGVFGWTNPSQLLVPATLVFGLAALVTAGIRLLNLWLGGRLAAAIGSDLSYEAYRRTLFQPYSVHVQRNSSTVINSLTAQVGTTVAAINLALTLLTSALVAVFLMLGLFLINWKVAVMSGIVFGSAYFFIGLYSRKRLVCNGQSMDHARSQVLRSLQEGLGAIRDALLDGTQGYYLETYRRFDRLQRRYQTSNLFLSVFPRFSLEAIGLIAIALLAGVLVVQVGSGAAALPLLGAFALGAQRLLPALQLTYNGWSFLKGSSADLAGVLELLEQPLPPVISRVEPLQLKRGIRFDGVDFRYDSGAQDVLKSLSFEIRAGECIGLIGSTGSGKTTSVDLLMGLLSPSSGLIEIDGFDLYDASRPEYLQRWRASIAHVPQSIYLADCSIAENIAFGEPVEQIDIERVRLAAEQAQIASFIESSQDGYGSFVGERGIRLSGGQRQRLGIARALYKNSSILILDEATSALDTATEQAVMNAITSLKANLTIVMIAHRLSTLAKCDRVIRLDDGRIVADGSPSEILS